MPNGHDTAYNGEWCRDRHQKIDDEFSEVWGKFRRMDRMFLAIMLALIGNLGGVTATLITLMVQGN